MAELLLSCRGCREESIVLSGPVMGNLVVEAKREGWEIEPALCPECVRKRVDDPSIGARMRRPPEKREELA